MIVPCCGDLRELKGGHYHKIVEITENAGICLLHEYTVRDHWRHFSMIRSLFNIMACFNTVLLHVNMTKCKREENL